MTFRARQPFRFGAQLRADRAALAALRWQFVGRGFLGTLPISSVIYHRSRPDLDRPDLENIFVPSSITAAHVWVPGVYHRAPDMLTVGNTLLAPRSRGSVELRSSNPLDAPRIRFNILSDPGDAARMRHNLQQTRRLVHEAPLAAHVGEETNPGAAAQTDAELDAFIGKNLRTAYHPTSTCRMGRNGEGVVDPELRVRGVDGLRVADASVMPTGIRGHTNAPSMMIGERAADLMLAAD